VCYKEGFVRTLVWFRGKDLRIADHPALAEAAAAGEVIPLFVLDPYFFAPERARAIAHRMQFLLESLAELSHSIERLGSQLVVVEGKSREVLPRLARELSVERVVAMRWVEPFARERDRHVAEALEALRIPFTLFEGETLAPPGSLRSGAGTPYAVFTRFAQAFRKQVTMGKVLAAPRRLSPLPALKVERARLPTLAELGIVHNPRLLVGGETQARARLDSFVRGPAAQYDELREQLAAAGTSRLSADLKFGTLSVRSAYTTVSAELGHTLAGEKFLSELLWREFSHSTLWDRPDLLERPFRADFTGFPWQRDERALAAWQSGHTGYPVVDAAARQLLAEGFVHNRARMIAASFLCKHLLVDYRLGEAHYMRLLTDGDWAQNNMGWQWSAGSGCDAQPYFRVFNPLSQGQKFDAAGTYVRRYVPELRELPNEHIHAPWLAPPLVLAAAGVRLGHDYPEPIVDHATARQRFLTVAAQHLKGARTSETR
jgi:deoxyribodipyrimidine photo-lyase